MLWTNLKLIAGFLLLLEVLRTLWQVGSPAPKVIPQAGRVAAVAWSPDSKMLAVSTISYEAFERGDGTKVFIDKSTVMSWDVSNAKAKWSLEEEEKTRIRRLRA